MTWSIGFRTAPTQELAEQFLFHLQDTLRLTGRYADPGLRRQQHPAEIGAAMIAQVETMLSRVRWNRATVREFLGRYLTEPKSQVLFSPPRRPLSAARFSAACVRRGLRLDRRTQLLFSGRTFFINGEPASVPAADRGALRRLADRRELDGFASLSPTVTGLLYGWYRDGFLAPR
jgi:50S ribosomal protein L16 3-hydroxylase